MKLPAGADKWGVVILGVVSVLLVSRMVAQFKGTVNTGPQFAAPAGAGRTHSGKGTSHVADDLARYDPAVHMDALKELDGRALPDSDRSPFEYVGGAAPPPPEIPKAPVKAPPPPPPPLPVKAMGYNDVPGGKEAFVQFEDNMQVVHEGDMLGTRFKIMKITPTALTLEDESDHTTHELPFPP